MIPLVSYSSTITQDSLSINKKQIKSIIKDKLALEYYKKQAILNDSIEAEQEHKISNLKLEILSYKKIENNQLIEIDYWKSAYNTQRRENKLIIIGSSVVVAGISYLYITK